MYTIVLTNKYGKKTWKNVCVVTDKQQDIHLHINVYVYIFIFQALSKYN